MKTNLLILIAAAAILVLPACNKKSDNGMSKLSVRMTDGPGHYDAVYIDVQAVEVTGSGGDHVMLTTGAGVYNLLDLANGQDTLIAVGDVHAGRVEQIRLILGSNNYVVVDGQQHPLSTPSAQQSGLKLKVHKDFEPGVAYQLLLDFDVHHSIVTQGNGGYSLKPVIRVVDNAISGSIRGVLAVPFPHATVIITDGANSYSTVTTANGDFFLAGVPPGTYSMIISGPFPFVNIIVSNIVVQAGVVTNVGVVG